MDNLSFHIITFGCQMNKSDSERMAHALEQIGLTMTESEHAADVVILNACSVRQKAIDRIWGKLAEFEKRKKQSGGKRPYTVLTGCVLPQDRKKFIPRFDLFFPIRELPLLKEKMEELIQNSANPSEPITPNSQAPANYLHIPARHSNPFSAFVPIMTGCNAFCTYCAVPYTRGREISRRPEEIITEVRNLLKKGYKEITLLGQIINKYMLKRDDNLDAFLEECANDCGFRIDDIPEFSDDAFRIHKLFKFHHLLSFIDAMASALPSPPDDGAPRFWLRFTSSHPKWFSEDLIQTIARCSAIPPHVHLPVQAGADSVLKRMLRPYSITEYKNTVSRIRSAIPNAAITTDCIVGFCGETDEEFEQTKDLFQWARYDMAFIAQYSPRPGTKAEQEMEDSVPHPVKKKREKELTEILAETALSHNKRLVGTDEWVLVDKQESVSGKDALYHGRTGHNKNVHFTAPARPSLVGTFVRVTIADARPFALKGTYA